MKMTDQIEQNVLLQFDEVEHSRLLAKYQDLTHVLAYDGFFKGVRTFGFIAQFFSLVLAVGFAILMAQKMPSLAFFIFALSIGLLGLLEYAKHHVLTKLNAVRIVNKGAQFPISLRHYTAGAVVLFGLSIGTSYLGSETVVTALTSHGELHDLGTINARFDTLKTKEQEYWGGLSDAFTAKAAELYRTNMKKDSSIHSAARKTNMAAEKEALEAKKGLSVAVVAVELERKAALKVAESKNEQIVSEHQIWCRSFSNITALLAFILDFMLVILIAWNSDFEHRKIKENQSRKALMEAEAEGIKELSAAALVSAVGSLEAKENEAILAANDKDNETLKNTVKQPVTQTAENIQIKQNNALVHGQIVPADGKRSARIAVELVGGDVVLRTKGELANLAKSNKGNRRNELFELLKNFDL